MANYKRTVNNPGRGSRAADVAPAANEPAPARGRPDGVNSSGAFDPGAKPAFKPKRNVLSHPGSDHPYGGAPLGPDMVVSRRTFPTVNGGANRA